MKRAFLIVIIFLIPAISFSAESPTAEYQRVQKKIMINKSKLSEAIEKEKSAIKDISKVKQDINKINSTIETHRAQITTLKQDILNSRTKLSSISSTLYEQKNQLKKKIRILQKLSDSSNRAVILLSTDDFYKMQRVNRYLSAIVENEFNQITDYSKTFNGLISKEKAIKDTLMLQHNEFLRLKKIEDDLIKLKQERESELLTSKEEQTLYQEQLNELEAISKKLRDLISASETSKTKYSGKGFSKSRGLLIWPVSGEVAIEYGSQDDPRFKSPIFRNGIFIKSDIDENVKAIYNGKVVFADQFRGLGNVVIVNHGEGYHTVYANLNKILLNNGDIVSEKDIIGKAGVPEPINGPGIYFEVRFKGKPINPSRWLSKTNTP
jgi:septal ring factor EnvC (AmiA/AmiB activator)